MVELESMLCVLELLTKLRHVARVGTLCFESKRAWLEAPARFGAPVHDGHFELRALWRRGILLLVAGR